MCTLIYINILSNSTIIIVVLPLIGEYIKCISYICIALFVQI